MLSRLAEAPQAYFVPTSAIGTQVAARSPASRARGRLIQDIDALNASSEVVNPYLQTLSNRTVVKRFVVKTRRGVERVVREIYPVH